MSKLLVTSGLFDPIDQRDRRRDAGVRHVRRDDPAAPPRCSTVDPISARSVRSTSPCGATATAASSTASRPSSTCRRSASTRPVPRRVHPGPEGRAGRRRRRGAGRARRRPCARSSRTRLRWHRSIPSSPTITGCTRCSSNRLTLDIPIAHGDLDVRPFQMGNDQAQEGRRRRQARQAVRQAGPPDRGRRPKRWW